MSSEPLHCVLLADRHHGLAEGLRDLLGAEFAAVVMVGDEVSLFETAERMRPVVAVVDLSLVRGKALSWISRLRERCPGMRLVVLSVHDVPTVRETVLAAGADAFLLKRDVVTDLLPAIDAVLASPPHGVTQANGEIANGEGNKPWN